MSLLNLDGQWGNAGGYSWFNEQGHLQMRGEARPWRDELTDALSIKIQGTGIAANATEATVEFATNSDLNDFLYINSQLNHDRDLSASIYPHIHWFQAENAIPNFLLRYRWQKNGGAKTTSWTDLKCITPAYTYVSGTIHQICYSTAISPPSGTTLSDIIQFKIYRDNANGSSNFGTPGTDTYSAVAGVIAFDIHFQVNSLGSTDEYVK